MTGAVVNSSTSKGQFAGYAGWLLLTGFTAYLGGLASIQAAAFYGELVQPVWSPPAWLFGPVWTVLYLMMAIAAILVWRQGGFTAHRLALMLFIVQLILNGLWSWLFFAWQLGGVALLDIALLWIAIVATAVAFWRVRPLAGALLIPYLVWVSFAAVLNFTLWQLNPELL